MKKIITIACGFALACMPMMAQVVVEEPQEENIEIVNDDEDPADEEDEAKDYTTPTTAVAQDANSLTVGGDIIDLPEGMTLDIDQLLMQWHAEQYLTIDSTMVSSEVRTFEPEEYQDKLSRIPAIMELPYNNVVQTFIDQYVGRLRRSVSYMLGASNFYIPIFEEALDRYGLPLELKYLPAIESAYNPTAVSRVGATGLWQFMITTAKRYGLEVNSLIDERRDPIKSSDAAARYLKDLYNIYGDWSLVLSAYNCGPGNTNKAIHRADGSRDYWKIYPYLPRETRGYVPAFIAANYVMNYYCDHDIVPMETAYPLATDTIMVTRDISLEQIAALCTEIDLSGLKALNPVYRTNLVPGSMKPCTLRLPTEVINKFIDLGDSIYNYRADELLTRRSIVEVAADDVHYRSTSTRYNNSRNSGRKGRQDKNSRRSKKNKGGRSKSVTIRQGDTLSDIARRNHTTVKNLQRLNGIKGSNIRAGKSIRVK